MDAGRRNLGEALRLERERCCAVLKEMMPEEEAGVLSAMLLGERSELTEETYLAYQQSGLLHLISVSGMHLMLLGMALRRRYGAVWHVYWQRNGDRACSDDVCGADGSCRSGKDV